MPNRLGKILSASAIALCTTVAHANAACEGARTTGTLLGAGAGSVVLGAITHSPAGWVGGAVLGGIVGHTMASNRCRAAHPYRHGYYDRHHRWHSYG